MPIWAVPVAFVVLPTSKKGAYPLTQIPVSDVCLTKTPWSLMWGLAKNWQATESSDHAHRSLPFLHPWHIPHPSQVKIQHGGCGLPGVSSLALSLFLNRQITSSAQRYLFGDVCLEIHLNTLYPATQYSQIPSTCFSYILHKWYILYYILYLLFSCFYIVNCKFYRRQIFGVFSAKEFQAFRTILEMYLTSHKHWQNTEKFKMTVQTSIKDSTVLVLYSD